MKKFSKMRFFYLAALCAMVVLIEAIIDVVFFHEGSWTDALLFNVSGHEVYMRLLVAAACVMLYLVFIKNRIIRDQKAEIENIFNHVIPVCITNTNYEIVKANDVYWSIWEKPDKKTIKCYEHRPGESCHTEKCALTQVINGKGEYICESKKEIGGEMRYYMVTAEPFFDARQKIVGVIESFQDITSLKALENERVNLISQLQSSLENVKLLSGLLPICPSCKKIKDCSGEWNKLEAYIKEHSEAKFSHRICPDCAKKLYPDLYQEAD